MKKVVSVFLFLLSIQLSLNAQYDPKNNPIHGNGDFDLYNFDVAYYQGDCMMSEKEFNDNKLVRYVFFNSTKDTLWNRWYSGDGSDTILGEEIFVFHDTIDRCFTVLHESIYMYYLESRKSYNKKGKLTDREDYVFLYDPALSRKCSYLKARYIYTLKGKLTRKYEIEYDENLNGTTTITNY